MPPYIDQRQNNVKRLAQVMDVQLTSRHKPEAQRTLDSLVVALDDMEKFKGLLAAYRSKRDAAKSGPIKAALAIKLAPPDLATSRDTAINTREQEIETMTRRACSAPR